jgi:hypothetical protein
MVVKDLLHYLRLGALTIIYVKKKSSSFAQYLHVFSCSFPRKFDLNNFILKLYCMASVNCPYFFTDAEFLLFVLSSAST